MLDFQIVQKSTLNALAKLLCNTREAPTLACRLINFNAALTIDTHSARKRNEVKSATSIELNVTEFFK